MDLYTHIRNRLIESKVLLDELENSVDQLDPIKHDLAYILRRAYKTQSNMLNFYETWDKSPEMIEQLEQISSVIKKIELLQNNYANPM